MKPLSLFVSSTLWLVCIVAGVVASESPSCEPCSCEPSSCEPSSHVATPPFPQPIPSTHVPNVVQVHARVLSGGLPEGDDAFRELQSLEVTTIVSVDGLRPDVERAKRFGFRYIHLPHGYDGISAERSMDLAKAIQQANGKVFIHCHHGKHRSPAAASVGCIVAGLISREQGGSILEVAGTSPQYRGLFDAVDRARAVGDGELAKWKVEFREIVDPPPIVESMVWMEQRLDRLSKMADGQAADAKDSAAVDTDVATAEEALLLYEQFVELARTEPARAQPNQFQQLLRAGESAAQELHRALASSGSPSVAPLPRAKLRQMVGHVRQTCIACHVQFRDPPLPHRKKGDAASQD